MSDLNRVMRLCKWRVGLLDVTECVFVQLSCGDRGMWCGQHQELGEVVLGVLWVFWRLFGMHFGAVVVVGR